MPRWFTSLCLGGVAVIAFACNDELVEDVPKDVCYSEKRWIGDKRGSPEMFPGRDCVGCHIDNDGPPLAIGGTLYAYVLPAPAVLDAQTGEDCFGIEGIAITIEDAEGQVFDLVTNRAGNFFIEGDPDDFAKPFTARIAGDGANPEEVPSPSMGTEPMYGGCARCHDPRAPSLMELGETFNLQPTDAEYTNAQPRIGLPGYKPNGPDAPSVEEELRAFVSAP